MPTQTFRYYPGYSYIKYLPKNSIITTSPKLCYCNSLLPHHTVRYTTPANLHHNVFHQLIILYSTNHLESYPTDPTHIYITILPTLRIQPASKQKENMLRLGTKSVGRIRLFSVSAIQYFTWCVWCGAVHTCTCCHIRFIDRFMMPEGDDL